MRVACCGLSTLDVIQRVDALPGPDEKVQAGSARVEFGGPAANAAFTAVALGCHATLISAVGTGPIGSVVTAQLAAAGIDLIDVAPPGWEPPVSAVAVVGEHRSVISTNAGGAPPAALPEASLDECSALLVDGHHLNLCVAAAATDIPVLLDGGSWKPGLERLLPHVDFAVLSADFPSDIEWDIPVAVTRGADPILLGSSENPVSQVEVVDTVGAGDVLHGATLVALAQGAAFEDAVRFASEVASQSCRYPGAHEWAAGRVTTEV